MKLKLLTISVSVLAVLSCGVMVSVQVDIPHFERVYSQRFEPPPSWSLAPFVPPVNEPITPAMVPAAEGGKAQEWMP